jgi:hypothetical protein
VVELIALEDGSLLLDLRRWRWLSDGRTIPTARGLAIRMAHAAVVGDAITEAIAVGAAIGLYIET